MKRSIVWGVLLVAACSGESGPAPGAEPSNAMQDAGTATAGDAGDGTTGDAAADTGAPDGADAATAADAGGAADAATAADAGEPRVELPAGSRELEHVVNLVDASAAEAVEAYLSSSGAPTNVLLSDALAAPVNLFLEHYEEVYDFLFLFTDHSLASGTIGRFEHINLPAAPGGSSELEVRAPGYRSTGRLKGAIAVQWRTPVGPPLSHETTHHWAVRLDPGFGFGEALNGGDPVHWGYTSVHGQLGGFDGDALRCETPAGASPPGCTPLASGRVRYVVPSFYPNSNPTALYAPLELYLMGVLPASEVPTTFQLLQQAETVLDSYDPATDTVVVEAAGITELAFADIVARHGEVALLPEDQRAFSAAFAVISREPASDEVMADVAEWAAAFGNRGTSPVVTPFETLAGGRATLDTRLGSRRRASDAPPPPREPLTCDVLAQDCPRAELGCYGLGPSYCALRGDVAEGQPCQRELACAPGLICVSGASNLDAYSCNPYCDPDQPASELACATLCPGQQIRVNDADQQTLGAFCTPP